MKIILASSSPRRKELLRLIVPEFDIMASEVEEVLEDKLSPKEQVERLSYIKAKSIYDKTTGNRIVIGSDTVVVKNKKIYGKPKDREDAKEMIKELLEGDRIHKIITGLTVMINEGEKYKEYKTSDEVKVYLKSMSDEEIEKWIDTGSWTDKAGAYGMQNEFSVFVEKIEGNYHTAIGLPTQKLYDVIKEYV
ncbi:MAG: Maf family protein, partial [Clostridia bacterium]|nr:Maf family protein [Clostridia bacterium]